MSLEYNYCGQCKWLEPTNKSSWSDKYYCKKPYQGGYHSLTEIACRDFIPDPEKMPKKGSYIPSGCYITTIVCNILKYEDNCELLTILRNFRDTFLKSNNEYLQLLLEYDTVGPIISNCISKRTDNYNFCLSLLKEYLIICANEIKNGNYEQAIEIYKDMVDYLKDEFDIPEIKVDFNIDNIETLGKGRIRILPNMI